MGETHQVREAAETVALNQGELGGVAVKQRRGGRRWRGSPTKDRERHSCDGELAGEVEEQGEDEGRRTRDEIFMLLLVLTHPNFALPLLLTALNHVEQAAAPSTPFPSVLSTRLARAPMRRRNQPTRTAARRNAAASSSRRGITLA